MNWFAQIFYRLAKKFDLSVTDKPLQVSDYAKIDSISLTATIANRLSTLTMLDSSISINGSSARAKFIDDFTQEFANDRLAVACEVALGTGDCLIKPYTDGARIGVDIIENDRFRVCESIGNYIKSCIILADTYKTEKGVTYYRVETQRLSASNGILILFIYQNAYKDGTEVALSDVPQWAEIKPVCYIPNVTSMGFGRIKCPTVNRGDINSTHGVKVTFGLDNVMEKAVEAYNRFNKEYENKESFIFADKTLFKPIKTSTRNADGSTTTIERPVLAAGKENVFMQVDSAGGVDTQKLIQEYSPQIRNESLEAGIEVNFKTLELLAGLSNGILTNPTTTFATATEMKASLQLTFAFITKFRKSIAKGVSELLNFVDVLCNVNSITPPGDWEEKFDWSSSYIEQMQEQFNRLLQSESIGVVDKAEVRAWVQDEDYEVAKERVAQIADETPPLEFGG